MAVGWKKSTTWVGDNCSLFLRNNHPHSSRLPLPRSSPPAPPHPVLVFQRRRPGPPRPLLPSLPRSPLPRRSPFLVAVGAAGLRGGGLAEGGGSRGLRKGGGRQRRGQPRAALQAERTSVAVGVAATAAETSAVVPLAVRRRFTRLSHRDEEGREAGKKGEGEEAAAAAEEGQRQWREVGAAQGG
ncbi:unnamed protein product [Musa acuminata subsp. malaccensis]|uniref:(wild Malaysian banana) hypothetical protein n=1 Tax=Musa acuminata subsp. malaccensis TaxID=214687 RepID=A0A8D7F4X7_MUSAM|nr:unnamed protein product [Musa acuminata subsp. malaccensis]